VITCTRRIQFCAGHRVLGHEGKCANIHGHNWVAMITAEAPVLDNVGRVVDFSVLKEKVGGWIDEHWDHGFIMFAKDDAVHHALIAFAGTNGSASKTWLSQENPTSENLADYLLRFVCPVVLKGTGVRVVKVVLFETENCAAEATL